MSRDCTLHGTLCYINWSSLKCGWLYTEIWSNRITFRTCLSVTDFKMNQVEITTTIFVAFWVRLFFGLCLFILNPVTQNLCSDLLFFLWCYVERWFLFFHSDSVATSVKIPYRGLQTKGTTGLEAALGQSVLKILQSIHFLYSFIKPILQSTSRNHFTTVCSTLDQTRYNNILSFKSFIPPLSHCQWPPRALSLPLVWEAVLKIQ